MSMTPFSMDCSIENSIFFCSISRGNHILYSHGGDRGLEGLSAAAIESAPPFHSRYSHTTGGRTFAFLIDDDDDHTYFVIADSSVGSAAAHRFLELMRDSFRRSSKNGIHDEVVPAVRRLIASLETLSRGSGGEKEKGDAKELWVDMPMTPEQRSSSPRVLMQQDGRRLFWRHVKIVVVVDVILCFVLFGIWLAVCRGFQCID